MRLSRTDLLPVLTIVAGGVIGASLSFNLLGSRSEDVPVTVGTVTGQVTDAQTGESVVAVQVYISALDLGGLTYKNGHYVIQNVPDGTHTLSVSRIGYRNTEAQITVGGGQSLEQNFSIAEEALSTGSPSAERTHSRFVEGMEELESVTESFQPVEVRAIRLR